MHRIPLAALLTLLAAIACNDTVVPDDSGTGDTATPDLPDEPPWWVTGHQGHVVYLEPSRPGQPRIAAAAFGEALPDAPFPALCVVSAGFPCLDAWPAELDTPTEAREAELVEGGKWDWVGDTIPFNGVDLPYLVDLDRGVSGYLAEGPGRLRSPLSLEITGEWGNQRIADGVVPPEPLVLLEPAAPALRLSEPRDVDLRWEPSANPGLEVAIVAATEDAQQVWRTADDGEFTLPASMYTALPPQAAITVTVLRGTEQELTLGSNTLRISTYSTASFGTGVNVPATCADLLAADSTLPSGPYLLTPTLGLPPSEIYCDMVTDGGGWSLVGSATTTLSDGVGSYHADLATLSPTSTNVFIWGGLRDAYASKLQDIRFACGVSPSTANTVDLSIYDVDWYMELTSGTEAQVCFEEGNGAGQTLPAPARRNNLTGESLPERTQWSSGELEGEDSCNSPDDFTVDFNDRGMDPERQTGTDWGRDDGSDKCGAFVYNVSARWFLFVR